MRNNSKPGNWVATVVLGGLGAAITIMLLSTPVVIQNGTIILIALIALIGLVVVVGALLYAMRMATRALVVQSAVLNPNGVTPEAAQLLNQYLAEGVRPGWVGGRPALVYPDQSYILIEDTDLTDSEIKYLQSGGRR